ncbi:MAG: hypothetical protein CFH41_00714 [Alphaproteobacteria bacterium MarineAlpha11_Bin1]|nr:MAG: hypothetical protein CFH41_00714 [Alphaproteobacteria bacterium MarineAlpha11_Bin1]
MRDMLSRLLMPALLSAVVFFAVFYWQAQAELELKNPKVISGWSLATAIIFLLIFNVRKRLSAFNLGLARVWFALHVTVGILTIAFFIIHAGTFWPVGLYEQLLALGFWLVSLTGIVGVFITLYFPKRLTNTGIEIIYEKIPEEIFHLRDQVEKTLIACAEECGETTLQEHYSQTLGWYFRRPRFYWSYIIGGNSDKAWLARHLDSVRRYLSGSEEEFLNKIQTLAERKCLVDEHYARQDVMKKWLLLHLPLSILVFVMSLWHIILVYSYSL